MPDPPDMWVRLARLDELCEVKVQSVYLTDATGTHREWEVTITRRDRAEEPVRVIHISLLRAASSALDFVEVRGWPVKAPAG